MTTENRNESIKSMYFMGYSLDQIAKEFDLSKTHIYNIVKESESPTSRKYKGISWDKYSRAFLVRVKGQYIGKYKSLEDAIYYRNKAAISLLGMKKALESGWINDPVSFNKV